MILAFRLECPAGGSRGRTGPKKNAGCSATIDDDDDDATDMVSSTNDDDNDDALTLSLSLYLFLESLQC